LAKRDFNYFTVNALRDCAFENKYESAVPFL
jgi:hypothetical protein